MQDNEWSGSIDRAERGLLGLVVAANVLFPAGLFLSGLPRAWKAFDGEASPINWFSSVQCALLGALGLAVYIVSRLGRSAGSDPIPRSWPWSGMAFGFFFLSFDERFSIHEQVRDVWLKPLGLFTEIPGLKPGDVVLPLYAVAGVVLTYFLVTDLRRYRTSLILFVTALALIFVAAFQDSANLRILNEDSIRPVQVVAEEVAETWAQALFAASLVMVLFAKLRRLAEKLRG